MIYAMGSDPRLPRRRFEITPDDNTDLHRHVHFIIVPSAGDVKVDSYGGDTTTMTFTAAGVYAARIRKIYATGTTVTGGPIIVEY